MSLLKLGNLGFNNITHDNNMGMVRYILSYYMVYGHVAVLTASSVPFDSYSRQAVGGFFTLSGFLLFASFQKHPSLHHYISNRARRILPPYTFIVLLAAISFSTISSLPFGEYFSNPGFWKYLAANLSFLNFLHPTLPGVFENNYLPAVNGSLWTMKGEWVCYLSIPILCIFLAKIKAKWRIIVLGLMIILSAAVEQILLNFGEATGNEIYPLLAKQFGELLLFFLLGAVLNMLLTNLYRHRWLYLGAAILILLLNFRLPLFYSLFLPVAVAILVIWISMIGKWGTRFGTRDNISYDIYLFHFPVIQLFISLGWSKLFPFWMFFPIVLISTTILAYISWNLVGKRFMKHKSV